jgi:cytochrome P450
MSAVDGGARPLPAGPRGRLAASIRYVRDPFTSLLEAASRFDDPFTWPTFLGPVVVTADPAGIKELLTADPDVYTALGADLLGPVLGASNLILLSGDRHRAMRKFYNPQFHGERLHAYGALIARIAEEHAARWPLERPFAVEDTLRAIALEVMLQAVLGLGEPEVRAAFEKALRAAIAALKPSFMFIPGLRRPMLGLSAWARYRRRAATVAALFEKELAARRSGGPGGSERTDILSLLVASRREDGTAFGAEEVFEQMVSLIGAGHETTASALTWALFHIHGDAAVKERLLDELRGLGAAADPIEVTRLPFLDAVCSETLRLNPVAPLIGRTLRAELSLKGHALPAGASVGISIVGLHRRPDLYPQPDQFRPERFLGRELGPFEYLPFGGGSRRCLGASFAVYEMKIVLATLLRAHDLRLTDTGPVGSALRNTTAAPAKKIRMVRARPK